MLKQVPWLFAIALFAIVSFGCREQASTNPLPKGRLSSNLKADEEILFFPTYGRQDPETNGWRFDVHGKVFEPEDSSAKRAALIALLQTSIDASVGGDDNAFRDDRIRPFLVDNERGKTVCIDLAGKQVIAGTSEANGHFLNSLILDTGRIANGKKNQIQEYNAVLREGDSRVFSGRVHLIPAEGVSVISDIDDTIKHSQVTDKSELLQNTFLREFRAVEGMPELYASLSDSDVAFHYVSGSPWQLYQPLDAFMSDVGFPKGTYHLKQFRLKDSTAIELLSSQQETKLAAITPLLDAFSERRFILIGDSGEQDPEIYGRIARQHAAQILGVFIRNVTGERSDSERFLTAFEGVPRDRWTLFDDVSQIAEQIRNGARAAQGRAGMASEVGIDSK